MAKYKAPKPKKSALKQDIRGALPCLIIVLGAIALLMLLFYWVLKSSS